MAGWSRPPLVLVLSLFLFLSLSLVLAHPAGAEQIAIITPLSEGLPVRDQEEIERWLRERLQRRWMQVVQSPGLSLSRLVRDPGLLARRRSAAGLLTQASAFVQQMGYGEARRLLTHATVDAEAGLARLVDPRLLAEIRLQWGVATLPTDPKRARQSMEQSYELWPEQQTHAVPGLSPKIADELRQARERALSRSVPTVEISQALAASRLLGVSRVLFLFVGARGTTVAVRLALLDARAARWVAQTSKASPASSGLAGLRRELGWALDRLAPIAPIAPIAPGATTGARTPSRAPARRPVGPWIMAGVSTAALATGALLLGLAHQQVAEAEALAGGQVEYYPEVHDRERTAQGLQTGGAVAVAVAGAAAVAALTWWLSPRAVEPSAGTRVGVGPCGVALTLPLR